jgi:hypothetical protein
MAKKVVVADPEGVVDGEPEVIERVFCAEPECDVVGFYSAYCEMYGHRRREVRYLREESVAAAARGVLPRTPTSP